jgi:hypothetical protein
LILGAISGCGSDKSSKTSAPASTPSSTSSLAEHPDPSTITCADVGRRDNFIPIYNVAVALAAQVHRKDASKQQVATRIYAAINDLCKRKRPADHPAADAAAAVRRGGYKGAHPALP